MDDFEDRQPDTNSNPNLNEERALTGNALDDSLSFDGDDMSEPGTVLRTTLPAPERAKAKRNYKKSAATGLSGRPYHVLCILNTYGWCTPEMVRQIANLHQINWADEGRGEYRILRVLADRGFVASRHIHDGTRTIAYAATQSGMAYVRGSGNDLLCDTNAIKDPASLFHFVGVNRIMLKFLSLYSRRYWLSDFQVRSENSFIGEAGLAKDYDSVAELVLPLGHVRFAVEYERVQKSANRYAKFRASLESERFLNCLFFFLDGRMQLKSLVRHFQRVGGFVYYVDYDEFLALGGEACASYWHVDRIKKATVNEVLIHMSERAPLPEYHPTYQLKLR
jgi:hypothetical protein